MTVTSSLKSGAAATRQRILDECERQIVRLQSGKLRLVDVATALGMSHANIYRYFDNRESLLDGLVDRWLTESEALATRHLEARGAAADRLVAMMVDMHLNKKKRLLAGAGVVEIYRRAIENDSKAAQFHRRFLGASITQLLAEGCSTGEFVICPAKIDPAANLLITMMIRFIHPLLVAATLDQDTENQARAVMKLYVESLKFTPSAFA